jgi:hypothetical protein
MEGFPPPRGGLTVRRVAILLTAVAVAMVIGSGVALAKTIRCDGGNSFGTNRHDAIFTKDGGDFVKGDDARYATQREHDVVSDARKELKEVSLHVGRWL